MTGRLAGPALGLALLAGAPAALAQGGLDWIYVEANTGGSSGGHVALRVRDAVYHVQQAPDGLWELNRDEWPTFRHLYAGLQNRTLALAALDVSASDLDRIEGRLAEAYVAQRAELARRDRLLLDVHWLEAWRDGASPPALPGAGLLARAGERDPRAEALRTRVLAARGAGSLARDLARAEAALAAFEPGAGGLEPLRETLLLREALLALDGALGLAEGALLPLEGPLAEPLSEAERRGAERLAAAQADAVLALLDSPRPDRGGALLLALARHLALAESAASGRLVLLDAYAGTELGELPPARERPAPETAARLAAELAPLVREGRTHVLAGAPDEVRLNLLEVGAAVWREFDAGARGAPVRKLPRRATPAAARRVAFAPARSAAALAEAESRARRALAAQRERLDERYRYGVLRRNCVTELARLLNDAFPHGDAERALGAALEPGAGLTFIPFAFFDAATARLRVTDVEVVPSHRERELARRLAEDPSRLRRAAESTTLGSSIYVPRLRDGRFLFFTEDAFWSRPLLGLANLGFAAGSGVVGLVAAPFDGAARLRAAGSGVWYSVPELFFFNIRKGTFAYVPREPATGGSRAPGSTPSSRGSPAAGSR